MEIEIFKEKLNQCLGVIEPLIKRGYGLPILNNILLETEKSFLKISATNLETSIVWRILTRVVKEGKICVPISYIHSLMGFLREDKIKIIVQKNTLILEGKDEINQIQGVNIEDFPIIPPIVKSDFIEIGSKELNQALLQIISIPAVSQIRPEISGIYFSFYGDALKIVGTDSFRLAEKTIKLGEKIKKDFNFILPQSAARELTNVLSLKSSNAKIYFNQNQVLFEWADDEVASPQIQFSSRVINGEYPNYEEIIPKKYTAKIIVEKQEFLNQVKKAGLFSGKISEIKITILKDKNKIKIFSESVDVGKNEAYIPVKMEEKIKEDLEVSFNYRFLIDGLASIKSSEVSFKESERDGERDGPATIMPVGDESFIYILMPIKAN